MQALAGGLAIDKAQLGNQSVILFYMRRQLLMPRAALIGNQTRRRVVVMREFRDRDGPARQREGFFGGRADGLVQDYTTFALLCRFERMEGGDGNGEKGANRRQDSINTSGHSMRERGRIMQVESKGKDVLRFFVTAGGDTMYGGIDSWRVDTARLNSRGSRGRIHHPLI